VFNKQNQNFTLEVKKYRKLNEALKATKSPKAQDLPLELQKTLFIL